MKKCPNCGFDKILPMYKFCPKCKAPLSLNVESKYESVVLETENMQAKGIGLLLMSYKKAVSDPQAFGEFAKKHPNDSRRLWEKWSGEGRDLSSLKPYYHSTDQFSNGPTESVVATVTEKSKHQINASSSETNENLAIQVSHVGPEIIKENLNDIDVVGSRNKEHNYVSWTIAPGQIACNISAQAFQELDKVDGVYVQEGVTAVVFVDGEQV